MHVDYSASLDSEHNLHLPSHNHYEQPGTSAASAFSSFRHPAGPAIDPGLEHSSAQSNGHAPMSSIHQAPNHLLQPDNASLNNPHISPQFYGDMQRPSHAPSTPSNASPRFSARSPTSQPRQIASSFVPSDRSPPSLDVTDATIDDAYAAFILYCNPNFSTTTNTSELRKLFRTPPKSDGKAFSTWTLFELIRKLDSKEIPTWTRLALDLGVEPPDIEKGQSTQKVQQYSVRLKRWMRAMHIDAFFEYLLGKQHPYYLQIPHPDAPFPENGRDGVPLEEDLAIRALDPKFRPKRGRRKADEGDDDIETLEGTPPRKRPQLDTSIAFGNVLQPQSAYPSSAHPDHMEGFLSAHDHWPGSAITPSSTLTSSSTPSRMNTGRNLTPYSASPMSGQQMRWRLNHDNPTTPHPLSAVTPLSAHPDYLDEPQSAITPSTSKPRSRRRHGPAVSSAWPSNNASSTGRLRGRPPSNRSVRDGPFVTFPANPKTKEGPVIDISRNPGNLTPIVERAHSDPPAPDPHFRFPPTPASAISPTNMDGTAQNGPQRPHRLSLQVPQNVGNPVRLVTPTVLVNGEQHSTAGNGHPPPVPSANATSGPPGYANGTLEHTGGTESTSHVPRSTPSQTYALSPGSMDILHVTPESLNRALAAELIRAPLSGRRKRLRGTEAKHLASAILRPLYSKPSTSSTATSKLITDQILSIAISSCLGLCSAVGLGQGGPQGGVRRIECTRFRVGGDGYESPVDEDEDDAEAGLSTATDIKESFDVNFGVSFGGLVGEWSVKGISASTPETGEDDVTNDRPNGEESDRGGKDQDSAATWKAKFLECQKKLWDSQETAKALREKVLDAVL
ncbi:uncharacterized protein EI97DRAFT_430120 [Westerdykella ornata]|uniref:ARS binding protein Abp2 n=1 Tax=Westerdykella ornata TaxID=318751 RepID=A0A6A6JUW9_WESOR|nr:uncharacterized protein EI97DRAFT_430120 [Westerdykella ornata]KAF2280382.1 hypothetical protein EI97DRAFT_430120 [Westerdykella ornata]